MTLRDNAEQTIRSWDAYERNRGTPAVIDYDCDPQDAPPEPATSRLEVFQTLLGLWQISDKDSPEVRRRIHSDLTYLRALMGERQTLDDYVTQTQGCRALGWSNAYIMERQELARKRLAAIGVGWNSETISEMSRTEGPLELDDVPDVVRQMITDLEPSVRKLTGADAPFTLTIEDVNIDAYWSYWLDGAGENARMRINLKNAVFTEVSARAFTLHEIFGHALQGASFSARAAKEDVPWVRLLSVHAPQQVLLEGLAQALPLFVIPNDQRAMARLSFVHYTQLVRAELHRLINSGKTVEHCVNRARSLAPFWTDESISNILADRGVNPQLRSYLWAYPAGLDWFVSLAEDGADFVGSVLHAAYQAPLTPQDLVALWPNGVPIGGSKTAE